MNRARRRRETKDFRRKFGQRGQIKNLILIVCEGKQTEPNYFRGFKLTNVDVDGAGADPMTVVERAKEIVLEQHKLGKKTMIKFGAFLIEMNFRQNGLTMQ